MTVSRQAYGFAQPVLARKRARRPLSSVLLAIVGGAFLVLMLLAWIAVAHNGYINAFASGLFVVAAWLMLVTGALAPGRTRAMARRLGSLLIVLVLTATGPTLSTAFARSTEERTFAMLDRAASDPAVDLREWFTKYEKVDFKYRRAGWRGAWMLARVEQASLAGDIGELEAILEEIESNDLPEYAEAKAAATTQREVSLGGAVTRDEERGG